MMRGKAKAAIPAQKRGSPAKKATAPRTKPPRTSERNLRLDIQRMPLGKLKPADYNPRRISDAALAGLSASIDRFGLVEPIVWNKKTKRVVGGHQRLKVLLDRGETDVDVIVVDLPPAEERALNVALNSPAIAGEFTPELEDLLDSIQGASPDLYSDLLLAELRGAGDERGGFRPGATDVASQVKDWREAKDFFTVSDEVRAKFEARKHIAVEFSGGKDSLACLLWARTMFPDMPTCAVFVDPGVEFPGMGAYVVDVAESLGAEPTIVKPVAEWWSWLAKLGQWPSLLYRQCAVQMIHTPFAKWAKQRTAEEWVVITGSRADEAVRGSKKTATSSLSSFGAKAEAYFHYAPVFNVKKPVLEAALEASRVPLWPGYAMGFVRTACWCCPGQRGEQACALQDNYPGLADEMRRWEKRIGPIRPLETDRTPTGKGRTFDDVLRAGRDRLARVKKQAAAQEQPPAKKTGKAVKRKRP